MICAKGRSGLVCTGMRGQNQLEQMLFHRLGAQKTFRYAKMLLISSMRAKSRSAPIPFWHSGADCKPWAKPSAATEMLLANEKRD